MRSEQTVRVFFIDPMVRWIRGEVALRVSGPVRVCWSILGIMLIGAAALKAGPGSSEPVAIPPWMVRSAACAELLGGVCLVMGRAPRVAASILQGIGLGGIIVGVWLGTEGFRQGGCGCLGPIRLRMFEHMSLAGLFAVSGAAIWLTVPQRGAGAGDPPGIGASRCPGGESAETAPPLGGTRVRPGHSLSKRGGA